MPGGRVLPVIVSTALHHLWLQDFRSYVTTEVEFSPALTVIMGDNGQGKTNLLESVGYLALSRSFRSAPTEALVRRGAEVAVVRAEAVRSDRQLLIEAEVRAGGRSRVQVNRQRVQRTRELLDVLQVSVFTPDDLHLVKDGPAGRRKYLDDGAAALRTRHEATRSEYERVLRQRSALLKQARGRLTDDIRTTLAVWNTKLVESGEELVAARLELLGAVGPRLSQAYDDVAGRPSQVMARYVSAWRDQGLQATLEAVADDEIRRGVTLAGPHRDDLELTIDGLPSRTHASQGEQRSLALALRLAVHRTVAEERGTAPVLLLDDVFSELDPARSEALLASLPPGQTIVTTAAPIPAQARADLVLEIQDGVVRPL
jgi:DNA replication and repair protein RecF